MKQSLISHLLPRSVSMRKPFVLLHRKILLLVKLKTLLTTLSILGYGYVVARISSEDSSITVKQSQNSSAKPWDSLTKKCLPWLLGTPSVDRLLFDRKLLHSNLFRL